MLRSATALAAGLIRELGDVALPAPLRRTKLYQSLVEATLRFLIEQIGEVEGAYPAEGKLAEDFAIRRAAGNGIEWMGILTFRASPVWVMAALADLSGAGRQLIQEIAGALKEERLLEPETRFENVDQILDGLEKSAGRVAEALNTPPLDVAGLRLEWAEIRRQVGTIPPRNLPSPDLLRRNWEELKREAAAQNRSVFELSSLMALAAIGRLPENLRWLSRCARSAARRTGQVFAGALLDHYAATLQEIRETGYLPYWTREFRPYLRAAADQFSPRRSSLTQRLTQRLLRRG
ncbi:MAG: hypothetical protein HY238_27585 [Acidobacteria bacterium]|nr:hypothetical protein [Acidobacteriota bacterium]